MHRGIKSAVGIAGHCCRITRPGILPRHLQSMGTVPLSDSDRVQLSARADEFHAALIRGAAGDWEKFLAGLPEHVRPAVWAELVIIDLAHRWERGERPRVEDYVARFPEFGPVERVPDAVVLE